MPGGDGTGPAGRGPRTGRAAGYCAGYNVPGYMNPVYGRGLGLRRGYGRGFGFGRGARGAGAPVPPAPQVPVNNPQAVPYYNQRGYNQYNSNYDEETARKQELNYLENAAKNLEQELSAVKERIEVLKEEDN